jgi:hypothetical protein
VVFGGFERRLSRRRGTQLAVIFFAHLLNQFRYMGVVDVNIRRDGLILKGNINTRKLHTWMCHKTESRNEESVTYES